MTRSTTDTLETLTDELKNFCDKEGLPHDSADDLLTNPALTEPQRQWLTDFCERWDALNQPEGDWDNDDDTTDTIETLTNELRDFCDKEGLPQYSAEDLLTSPGLTEPQRRWLADLCERWDALNPDMSGDL